MFQSRSICDEGEDAGIEYSNNERGSVEREEEDKWVEKEEAISNEGRFDRLSVTRGAEDIENIQFNFQIDPEDDDFDDDENDKLHPGEIPVADVDIETAIYSGDVVEVARLLESGYEVNACCGEDDEPMLQVDAEKN